jgi:hypothetical protein
VRKRSLLVAIAEGRGGGGGGGGGERRGMEWSFGECPYFGHALKNAWLLVERKEKVG